MAGFDLPGDTERFDQALQCYEQALQTHDDGLHFDSLPDPA